MKIKEKDEDISQEISCKNTLINNINKIKIENGITNGY